MSKPHVISHVEIPALDGKSSGSFYSNIFGWKVNTLEEFNYTMFHPESGPEGGFVQIRENPTMHGQSTKQVLIYISTDDLDATVAKIEAEGGKILERRIEVPGTGWFAIFQDPAENYIGLFQYL